MVERSAWDRKSQDNLAFAPILAKMIRSCDLMPTSPERQRRAKARVAGPPG